MSMSGGPVVLPPGIQVTPGRESTVMNANNQAVPGMYFNIRLESGATTSVFVPYDLLQNTEAIQRLIVDRVNGITAVTQLGS